MGKTVREGMILGKMFRLIMVNDIYEPDYVQYGTKTLSLRGDLTPSLEAVVPHAYAGKSIDHWKTFVQTGIAKGIFS
jgi:hypothetical protein